MKGHLILYGETLGEIDFKVIDETMGGIGGVLVPHPNYEKYRTQFQDLSNSPQGVRSMDFPFLITINGKKIPDPIGGIVLLHLRENDDEPHVDAAGVDRETIEMFYAQK